jgi:carboxynorspermidine decarboxylase
LLEETPSSDAPAEQRFAWAEAVETPAFVIDERPVRAALATVERIRREIGARVLYALKPLAHRDVLGWMRDHVDGFAASSLYEARFARAVLGPGKTVSITTPCFREDEIDSIAALCDHLVLNSLSQWQRFRSRLAGRTSVGLRVNPGLSFIADERYDPCRSHSKLGVPVAALAEAYSAGLAAWGDLEGIHFHTNCESESFTPLLETVRLLSRELDPLLHSMRWINLGGGYLLNDPATFGPMYEAVRFLRDRYSAAVLLEPGAALVRDAGYLVGSVVDLIPSGVITIAVLDTTVNHAPEVYEYQLQPEAVGHDLAHPHRYLLAGASCLAGDLFGEYRSTRPLRIGSRVVFVKMGAYTLVKAHLFNGINLPTLYTITNRGELLPGRRFTFADYLQRLGVDAVREDLRACI